ncbi:MAG TPA: hypothetical protein PKV73_01110 [Agriterribacter sp.]|nr:hypothetical protein [Agriterribacter sp.]
MQLACAKNLQQGYLSPQDFYFSINQAQRSYLDYLKGEYQKYRDKRPIAAVEFGNSMQVRTSLAPLVYSTFLPINSSTGIANFPSDFEEVDSMFSAYGIYDIRFVQQPRLSNFRHSSIDPVTENPIYIIKHEGFQYFPGDIGQAYMSYYRTPPSIVWGWVEDSNGVPVYNPATSQDPVWSETDILQIIARALAILGVSMQAAAVAQYANDITKNGQ